MSAETGRFGASSSAGYNSEQHGCNTLLTVINEDGCVKQFIPNRASEGHFKLCSHKKKKTQKETDCSKYRPRVNDSLEGHMPLG